MLLELTSRSIVLGLEGSGLGLGLGVEGPGLGLACCGLDYKSGQK